MDMKRQCANERVSRRPPQRSKRAGKPRQRLSVVAASPSAVNREGPVYRVLPGI